MNCKLCGYYYSSHERGNTCQHCGGNREGLHKTRLMTVSKILVVTAFIILAFLCAAIVYDNISDMYEQQYYSDDGGGTHWETLIYLSCLMSYLFSFPVIFRTKKCNFSHYIVSAILLFPTVFIMLDETILAVVPCLLLIVSALTALIDKKKQIREYEIKRC